VHRDLRTCLRPLPPRHRPDWRLLCVSAATLALGVLAALVGVPLHSPVTTTGPERTAIENKYRVVVIDVAVPVGRNRLRDVTVRLSSGTQQCTVSGSAEDPTLNCAAGEPPRRVTRNWPADRAVPVRTATDQVPDFEAPAEVLNATLSKRTPAGAR
jgi:hypothetical protein